MTPSLSPAAKERHSVCLLSQIDSNILLLRSYGNSGREGIGDRASSRYIERKIACHAQPFFAHSVSSAVPSTVSPHFVVTASILGLVKFYSCRRKPERVERVERRERTLRGFAIARTPVAQNNSFPRRE